MSKHTPGPWRVFEHSWCDTSIVADGFDHGICSLDINHATEETQEADEALMAANARLISAAPELLEALIKCRDEMGQLPHSLGYEFTHLRALNELIAKATGESP